MIDDQNIDRFYMDDDNAKRVFMSCVWMGKAEDDDEKCRLDICYIFMI